MSESRNAKPGEMVSVGGNAPPDWAAAYLQDDKSLDTLKKHKLVPRLKIVQALSPEALKDAHGEGSAVLAPANALVCRKGESFDFVPLFFFVEYMKWSDRNDKESLAIVSRSFDQGSELARRALDPELRQELYDPERPKGFSYAYQEHLNWIGYIHGNSPLAGNEVCISFARGEHKHGKAFIGACALRGVPLWMNVFRFTIGKHTSGDNTWWGLDYSSPDNPFIAQEQAEEFKAQHELLASQFAEQLITTDYADVDEDKRNASNPAGQAAGSL